MSEFNYHVKIKGTAEALEQVPAVLQQLTDLEYHQISANAKTRPFKNDGLSVLEWDSEYLHGYFDADELQELYIQLADKLPGLEVYIDVSVTVAGIVHGERGVLRSGEWDWDSWALLVMTIADVYGMVDLHGTRHELNCWDIADFHLETVPATSEDDVEEVFTEVSGGETVLRLTPGGEWDCVLENMGDWWDLTESLSDDEADRLLEEAYSFFQFGPAEDDPEAWSERYAAEDLLKILSLALPDVQLHIEDCSGIPHFLDAEGNEYFSGKMIAFCGDLHYESWEGDSI